MPSARVHALLFDYPKHVTVLFQIFSYKIVAHVVACVPAQNKTETKKRSGKYRHSEHDETRGNLEFVRISISQQS